MLRGLPAISLGEKISGSKYAGHQLETLANGQQLSHRSANSAKALHLLLSLANRVAATGSSITEQLPVAGSLPIVSGVALII